jgi:hypothetical protein
VSSPHAWAGLSDQDFLELLANAPSRGAGGKPLRRHYASNLLDVIHALRRSGYARGRRYFTTVAQLHVARGGEDQGSHEANHDHAHTALTRYLRALEEIGAVAWEGRQGDGGGLFIELRDPRLHSGALSARSSAG